jgi:hypothetical protein
VLKFAGNSSKLKRSSNCKQEENMKYKRKGLKKLLTPKASKGAHL